MVKCLVFAGSHTELSEGTVQDTLFAMASVEGRDERSLVNAVLQANKCLTSRVLNNLNAKLVDVLEWSHDHRVDREGKRGALAL